MSELVKSLGDNNFELAKPTIGRPSSFTQEKADEICDLLSDGKSLRSVCAMEGMPPKITVLRWLRTNEDFRVQYARAKDESADSHADDITDISDDKSEDPQSRRVRIDARKWVASKLTPKKYGDKLEAKVEHSGGVTLTVGQSDPDL